MRIAELSQASGLPIPTIKYYLREGLLAPGVTTAPNQARYDQSHLDRLELIRALREGAGLNIATLSRVFAAMDARQGESRPEFLSMAVRALSDPHDVPRDDEASTRAERDVAELLDGLEWDVDPDSPGRDDLLRAVAAIHRFLPGLIRTGDQLRAHADAMRALADVEIPQTFDPAADPEAALRLAVLGTALFEPALLALRKLAHVDRLRGIAAGRPSPSADVDQPSRSAPHPTRQNTTAE
ncbi:MAG TPA: MerR family transcriptional regulator [Ilumatobacter sp.]|nr:MerR family transcriptional regulator [Ilumatobacter sp.]